MATVYTDTFFATTALGPSVRKYKMVQLFVTDFGFIDCQRMKTKSEVPLAFKQFFKKWGAPDVMVMDSAPEQISGESRRLLQQCNVTIKPLERDTPWANRAELHIGIIKNRVREQLRKTHCPMVLWCYCVERETQVMRSSARNIYSSDGMVPSSKLTGQPTDISNLSEFGFYEWCYYRDHQQPFPMQTKRLG